VEKTGCNGARLRLHRGARLGLAMVMRGDQENEIARADVQKDTTVMSGRAFGSGGQSRIWTMGHAGLRTNLKEESTERR